MKKEILFIGFVMFIILTTLSCKKETNTLIATTDLTVTPKSLLLDAGNTDTLIATLNPSNATNNLINWRSSNSGIATVNSVGVVTAIGGGSATITATTADGNKKDSCTIKVMKWITYNTSNGLVNNSVNAIAIDAQGNKWFGTSGGVSKFDGTNWTNYTTNDGLANNFIYSIAIDNQGNKWFGTSGGVSKFDGTIWTNFSAPNYLASSTVLCIAIDAKGDKWFGTAYGGISKFDDLKWTTYYGNDHLNVLAIAIDKLGNKWFGTDLGVWKYNDSNWTNLQAGQGLRDNIVPAIAIDAQGNKWFGTASMGASKFDDLNWTNYSVGNGLFYSIRTIAIDSLGNVWFGNNGGSGGLAKFNGTNFTTYKVSKGLTSNYINTIVIDEKDNKWFGSITSGVIELQD